MCTTFSSASIGRSVPSAVVVSARPIEQRREREAGERRARPRSDRDRERHEPADARELERPPLDLRELDLVARHEEEEAQTEGRQRGDGGRLRGEGQHLRADQDPGEQLEHDARHLAAGRLREQRRHGRDGRDQRDGRECLGVHASFTALRTSAPLSRTTAQCATGAPRTMPARAGAGVVAVALDDLTVDDGGDEAVGALQHALGARPGGRAPPPSGCGVIASVSSTLRSALRPGSTAPRSRRPYIAAGSLVRICTAVSSGRVPRAALAHPVGEQERRVAGVADEVDVGTAVAEAEHGLPGAPAARRLTSRLPGVAAEEVVDERVAVVGDGPVVEQLLGVAPERLGLRREAASRDRARSRARGATGRPRSRLREHQVAEPRHARSAGARRRSRPCTSGSAMRGGAARRPAGARAPRTWGRPRNACDVRSPQNRP